MCTNFSMSQQKRFKWTSQPLALGSIFAKLSHRHSDYTFWCEFVRGRERERDRQLAWMRNKERNVNSRRKRVKDRSSVHLLLLLLLQCHSRVLSANFACMYTSPFDYVNNKFVWFFLRFPANNIPINWWH